MNDPQTSTETSESRLSGDARQPGSTPAGVSVEHLEALVTHLQNCAKKHRACASAAADTNSQHAAADRGRALGYDAAAAKLSSVIRRKS